MKKKNLLPQLSAPVQRTNSVSALKGQEGISLSDYDPRECMKWCIRTHPGRGRWCADYCSW